MARLIISSPEGKRGILELTKPVITIGRGNANDLVLNNSRVSRFHAVVKISASGDILIADRGSTNGVLINGERIIGETLLRNDDRIGIGDYEIRFESVEDASLQVSKAEMPSTLNEMLRGGKRQQALGQSTSQPLGFGRSTTGIVLDDTTELRKQLRKLERENYLLSVLYDSGKALHSKLSIDDIVSEVSQLAFRIEGVERGFMMLFDDKGQVSHQTDVWYRKPPTAGGLEQPRIILSRAVLDRVRSEREPILIADLTEDERFSGSESMKVSGLRSAMVAPLVAQQNLAGILYVDNLEKTAAFTQEELNIFAVVASQAAAAIDGAITHTKLARQAIERSALERFLAPEVVELISANPEEVRLGGANAKVSVLFADIRGFTPLSEALPPERIVEILNEYFTRVTEVIFEHGGTLDKYLGDGLMALFGAPVSKGNDAVNAVRAALGIQQLMTELNQEGTNRGWPDLRVGIGVNTGVVTAGNIGSPKRIDYTVIGDAVNVSSRLCSNAQPGQILISESTVEEVDGVFQLDPLEPLQLKGKSRPLPVFNVIGEQSAAKK
jgi:adenylate cyclase